MPDAQLHHHPDPEEARLAQWRVWAAAVRDRQGPHASLPHEIARLGGLLCQMLDAWEAVRRLTTRPDTPSNLDAPLCEALACVVGRLLLLHGVSPP